MSELQKALDEIERLKRERREDDAHWRKGVDSTLSEIKNDLQANNKSTEHIKTTCDELKKEVKTATHILTGNGKPQDGVVFRLAQVESNQATAKWIATLFAVPLIGLIVKSAYEWFKKTP